LEPLHNAPLNKISHHYVTLLCHYIKHQYRHCFRKAPSTPATISKHLTGNFVEATFDFVERIVRLVAFDNVASTLLLVWTGRYIDHCSPTAVGRHGKSSRLKLKVKFSKPVLTT